MSKYPEITNSEYHEMGFDELEKIRDNISSKKVGLFLNESQLLLYLNQMEKRYSFQLTWIQYLSTLFFIGIFVFIFINWKISPILFVIFYITHSLNRILARRYIIKQCSEDRVFLKFALSVGLAKIRENNKAWKEAVAKTLKP